MITLSPEKTKKINKEIEDTSKILARLTELEWQRALGYIEGIIASKTAKKGSE